MLKDFQLSCLVKPLLEWYPTHARVLPWRETLNPYHIWVSEIMLQQTRVEAVKPYFSRFIKELPDIPALAACPQERLLKLWEGLGYYSRASNMQHAAQEMVEKYGGRLPADFSKLLGLKGIGRYTAGAIASIAYGIPVPAVDGNVMRVLMRVSQDNSDIMKQSVKAGAERLLQPIIPENKAGIFTQALMELGAVVCLPNGEPKCTQCPWEPYCLAYKNGTYHSLPHKGKAKPRKIEEKTVILIRDGEKVLLHKRPQRGLLAGMYEFPNVQGHLSKKEAADYVGNMGLVPLRIEALGQSKHIFSHVEWHMAGYMVRVAQLDEGQEAQDGYVFAEAAVSEEKYAIPSAFAKYTKYMNIRLGKERMQL